MNFENHADNWINRTHESIKNIQRLLNAKDEQFVELANFILETDINPYSFLPFGWEGSLYTAEGAESLLSIIHHALVDDGELCWINTDIHGPLLAFEDKYETDHINTLMEKRFRNVWPVKYTIHSYSSEFIKTLVEYQIEHERKCAEWEKRM